MGKDTLVLFHTEQEAGPLSSDSGQAQNSNGRSSETQLRTDKKRNVSIYRVICSLDMGFSMSTPHNSCILLSQRESLHFSLSCKGFSIGKRMARWLKGRQRLKLLKARVLCRERIMVTEMQRDLNIPRGATPLPHVSTSPFPFLLWRSWVIRRNSLLGKRRGWCPCVLIRAEVFRETWETSRRGSQCCTAAELISQHPLPKRRRVGGPVSWRQRKGCHCPFFLFRTSVSLSLRFSCSDTSHGH